MKKLSSFLALFAVVFVLASSMSFAADFELKLHHPGGDGHPYTLGAELFKKLVEERSKGSLKIDIYPNNSIASGAKAVEAVQMGTLDMALESSMTLSNFVPEVGVLDMPFLFENREFVYKVLDGDIGKDLAAKAHDNGFEILYFWDNGFRNISNGKRPVLTPDDLKGLKIRVTQSKVYVATFEALGAIPTPMAFNELFTALQLHTVDGQENPNGHLITYNLYEVQKYYSITQHSYTAQPLMINLDLYETRSDEQKQILRDAVKEAGDYQRKLSSEKESYYLAQIKEKGIEVSEPDREPFRKAVAPVYEQFADRYGSLISRIREVK